MEVNNLFMYLLTKVPGVRGLNTEFLEIRLRARSHLRFKIGRQKIERWTTC